MLCTFRYVYVERLFWFNSASLSDSKTSSFLLGDGAGWSEPCHAVPCAGPVRLDDSAESIGSTVLVEIDGGIAVAWSTWKEMQRIHSTLCAPE